MSTGRLNCFVKLIIMNTKTSVASSELTPTLVPTLPTYFPLSSSQTNCFLIDIE